MDWKFFIRNKISHQVALAQIEEVRAECKPHLGECVTSLEKAEISLTQLEQTCGPEGLTEQRTKLKGKSYHR